MLRKTVLLALPCLLSLQVAARAGDISRVFKRIRSSVVVIVTEQQEIDPITSIGLVSVGGLGSGVLVSEDGKILTAAHVVQTADEIQVRFHSGEIIDARVVASEPAADVALLQLESLPIMAEVAALGDSDEVEVGDEIFVVGAPMGISHSLTVGHISARRIEDEVFGFTLPTELFQTDAAINQGNSGGPMFDLRGRVVGIVSYIISQGGGSEGLGFVVTSNMARSLLLERSPMWSGLQGQILEEPLARMLNVPQDRALLIQHVAAGSPASDMGLRGGLLKAAIGDLELVLGGDVVLEVQGVSLADRESAETIRERLRSLGPGDVLALKVLRGGEIVEIEHHLPEGSFLSPSTGAKPPRRSKILR